MPRKRVLFLLRHPPGAIALESLDAALVAAAFDQEVSLLFKSRGVLQIADRGPVSAADSRNTDVETQLAERIASLGEYGIGAIFTCQRSLGTYSIETGRLPGSVSVLDEPAQSRLIARQDVVATD